MYFREGLVGQWSWLDVGNTQTERWLQRKLKSWKKGDKFKCKCEQILKSGQRQSVHSEEVPRAQRQSYRHYNLKEYILHEKVSGEHYVRVGCAYPNSLRVAFCRDRVANGISRPVYYLSSFYALAFYVSVSLMKRPCCFCSALFFWGLVLLQQRYFSFMPSTVIEDGERSVNVLS